MKKLKKKKEENLAADSKLEVNLLPSNINLPPKGELYAVFISAFVLSIMVIILAYFAVDIYKLKIDKEISEVEEEINLQASNLEEYDNLITEISSWKNKADYIKSLFDYHIYWTKFFSILEENTLKEVKFSNFSSSIDGSLSLNGSAPDYYTVSKQWKHLKNAPDFVKGITIQGASLSGTGNDIKVNFNIVLDLADGIFLNF